ncbi:MAG: hypothetical protein WC762_12700 [Methylobacter sp.]|jgi:hypothetical protein
MKILFFAVSLILSGCAIPFKEKEGTSYHLIVGIGLIAVNDKNEAATVTNTRVIGISLSDQPGLKFAAGYSSNKVVTVSGSSKVVSLGVSESPLGDISINFNHMKVTQ